MAPSWSRTGELLRTSRLALEQKAPNASICSGAWNEEPFRFCGDHAETHLDFSLSLFNLSEKWKKKKRKPLTFEFYPLISLTLVEGTTRTSWQWSAECFQDGRRQGDSLALCVQIHGTFHPQGGADGALTCHRLELTLAALARWQLLSLSCGLHCRSPWNCAFTGRLL